MKTLKSICVYCGSNAGSQPLFEQAAIQLGELLAREGIRLVYGGGSIGLMGAVAKTVLENGGEVTGVIPKFLKEREVMLEEAHELIVTQDMHERLFISVPRDRTHHVGLFVFAAAHRPVLQIWPAVQRSQSRLVPADPLRTGTANGLLRSGRIVAYRGRSS